MLVFKKPHPSSGLSQIKCRWQEANIIGISKRANVWYYIIQVIPVHGPRYVILRRFTSFRNVHEKILLLKKETCPFPYPRWFQTIWKNDIHLLSGRKRQLQNVLSYWISTSLSSLSYSSGTILSDFFLQDDNTSPHEKQVMVSSLSNISPKGPSQYTSFAYACSPQITFLPSTPKKVKSKEISL